ncbi:uncharacterized protein LOC110713029 isoform X1 [Chenopodium quinoa]|uniref:uncharacterized protein LOC110713029 isoform X1 n=1 Tax=Chenopodium quinoa TaxID=63459 RepID=UPI000B78EF86|nr:uncharacterized protein LOC110713029 isoform X1 [Chenopodium quinoa]
MASLINCLSAIRILSPRSFLVALILISSLLQLSLSHQLRTNEEEEGFGRRKLLGFKEKPDGSNTTFECSPSGPCVSCQYSEKKDDKYRCSETGYRIPFKCIKVGDVKKETIGNVPQNGQSTQEGSVNADNVATKHRTLATDKSSSQKGEPLEYVTYRSCIQGVNEEKLSVLGFEVLILGLLLVSGSFVFIRQKKTVAMAGIGNARVQSNSRF